MIDLFFFGQHAPLSAGALAALLDAGLRPRLVVAAWRQLPGRAGLRRWPPGACGQDDDQGRGPCDLRRLCGPQRLELLETRAVNDPATLAALELSRPQLLVVAGCDTLFGPALLALPRVAGINLHPSWLPRWRGPSPFFWIFRQDDWASAGVSLHHLDAREDHGPLLDQAPLAAADCATIGAYLARAGELGGRLLATLLARHGAALPAGTPQDHARACRAPRPRDADLRVEPRDLAGARLAAFVNGVADSYRPWCALGGERFELRRVLELRPGKRLAAQYALVGERLFLPVADGLAVCALAGPPVPLAATGEG